MLSAIPFSATEKAMTIDELRAPVEGHMASLRRYLEAQIQAFEPETQEMVSYCLRHEGKQLRPMLVFYAGLNVEPDTPAYRDLIRAAAVVEMVHQATLVHDDILDNARTRHSQETPWGRYGTSTAVLLGDALFSQALHLAASFDTVHVCRAVSQATRRVCSGEIAQTFYRGNGKQGFDLYFRVIDLKTAELFRVACELGASLSCRSEEVVEAAASFGRHLGIAYQIFDDLADLAGDEARIGKTLGTDLASGKLTLPLLLLLEALPKAEAEKLRHEMLEGLQPVQALRPLLAQHGAFEGSVARFQEELRTAEAYLDSVCQHYPEADALTRLSHFVRQQVARLPLG